MDFIARCIGFCCLLNNRRGMPLIGFLLVASIIIWAGTHTYELNEKQTNVKKTCKSFEIAKKRNQTRVRNELLKWKFENENKARTANG